MAEQTFEEKETLLSEIAQSEAQRRAYNKSADSCYLAAKTAGVTGDELSQIEAQLTQGNLAGAQARLAELKEKAEVERDYMQSFKDMAEGRITPETYRKIQEKRRGYA